MTQSSNVRKGVLTSLLSCLLALGVFPQVYAISPLFYPENHCLEFDGVDDYTSCGFLEVYKAGKLTIELWIRPKYTIQPGSDLDYGHFKGEVITFWTTQGWKLEFNFVEGLLHFVYSIPAYPGIVDLSMSRSIWLNGSWYHIAIAFDPYGSPPNWNSYVNASIDSQYSLSYSVAYEDSDLRIGGSVGKEFGGMIDEVRLWKTCRSSSQIKDCWIRVLNETETISNDLVGYWRFDEGVGDTSKDYSTQNNAAMLAAAPYNPTWIDLGAPIVPEFPSFLILPLLMIVTLIAVIASRRKHSTKLH